LPPTIPTVLIVSDFRHIRKDCYFRHLAADEKRLRVPTTRGIVASSNTHENTTRTARDGSPKTLSLMDATPRKILRLSDKNTLSLPQDTLLTTLICFSIPEPGAVAKRGPIAKLDF